MPFFTNAKDHTPGALRFDAAFALDFNPIALAASSPVNTTIETAIPLPCNVKIYSVAIMNSVAPTGTLTGFNIVAGTAAEGTTGTANTLAVNGTKMFALDTGQVPVNTIWTPTIFNVPQSLMDVIWPTTLPLTVRMTGTTITGTYFIQVLCKVYDANQTKPMYTAAGVLTI